ncbi:MAG: FtsX-like permease family protein [Bacillota bacterium]
MRTTIRPAVTWSLAAKMVVRRLRRDPSAALLVSLSVTLTVALCVFIVSMVTLSGWRTMARTETMELPYDAVILFSEHQDAVRAQDSLGRLRNSYSIHRFPFVEVDTEIGPLFIVGMELNLPGDVIVLNVRDADLVREMEMDPRRKGSLDAWPLESGISVQGARLTWSTIWSCQDVDASDDVLRRTVTSLPVPPGWAVVDTERLNGVAGVRTGLGLEFVGDPQHIDKPRELSDLRRQYPDAVIFGPWSGESFVSKELVRPTLLWQTVYCLGALTGTAAISCVLTASFLGRKRSLGILRVLGGTRGDLLRVVLVEALYLGVLGVPLGSVVGFLVSRFFLDAWVVTFATALVPVGLGVAAIIAGASLPIRLVRNATCDQLLNNRPVYAMSNPSCAQCGLCGGF